MHLHLLLFISFNNISILCNHIYVSQVSYIRKTIEIIVLRHVYNYFYSYQITKLVFFAGQPIFHMYQLIELSYDFDAKYQDDRFINMQIYDILAIISFCLIISKRRVYVYYHSANINMMVC